MKQSHAQAPKNIQCQAFNPPSKISKREFSVNYYINHLHFFMGKSKGKSD